MRNILLDYQNTEASNGLFEEDENAFVHAAGDIVEAPPSTGEWVGSEAKG
jgi:hypothetical protein